MGSGSRLEDYYHRIGEPSPTTATSRTSSSSNDLSSDDQIRTQVLNVRMSLAEKRAQMEQERRMNDDLARERWDTIKRGAFLQAVGGSRRNVSQDGQYVDRYAYATGGDHEDDHDEYIASVHHHSHDQTEEDADDEDDQSFQLHQLSSESYSRCSNPPNNHHNSSTSNVYRNYDYEDLNGHRNRSDKHDYHSRDDSPDRRGSYNQSPELSRSASSSSSSSFSSTASDEDRHDEEESNCRESSENLEHSDFRNVPTASRMTSKERAEKTYSNTSNLDKEDETVPEYTCEKGFFISFADDKMPKPKPPVLRPKNIRAVTVGKDRRLSGSRTDLNNSNHHQTSHHPHHRLSKNDKSSSLLSHSGSKIKDKEFASNDSDSIPFMLNSSESSKVESNDDVDSTRYSSHVSPSPVASSGLFSPEASITKSSNASHQNTESVPIQKPKSTPIASEGFVIGADTLNMDPISELEMARKKEMIIMQSLQRKADHEAKLRAKKLEIERRCDLERQEQELKARKREEERIRRQIILEKHRQRKAREDSEKDGNSSNFSNLSSRDLSRNSGTMLLGVRSRPRPSSGTKPRPKSLYVKTSDMQDYTSLDPGSSRLDSDSVDSSYPNFSSTLALNSSGSLNKPNSRPGSSMSNCNNMIKRLPSPTSRLPQIPPSLTMNRYRGPSSDGASDAGSTFSEYTGPKLYVKPAQKSNRGIILNAINVVLAGAVNGETKKKVLEEINNSESKHFLILFRGSGMQFRGIYSYNPIIGEVVRLHGKGPKIVTDDMMDKFYKYNCGGRNFNEVLTKHLTVTIDAFTIHNTLWSGKRAMPAKTDSS